MRIIILGFLCLVCSKMLPSTIYDVKYIGVHDGMTSNYVQDIAQDKNGMLWFATEEGLNRFDGSRFFTYYKDDGIGTSISCDELSDLMDDPKYPIMWIGTQNGGLNMYDYSSNEFKYFRHDKNDPNSISGNYISDICTSADGYIWIATSSGGIDRFGKGEAVFEHYNSENVKGLTDNNFWCVLDNGHGWLYAGHTNEGLSIIDIKNRKAVNFKHDEGNPNSISGNEVICLYKDHAGRIWVGTEAGLDVFNAEDKNFIHIAKDRIGRQRIYHIIGFKDGRIWVGTERLGIIVINPDDIDYTNAQDIPCTFINSGKTAYRLSGNDVRCLFEDQFGQIWVGLWEGGVNILTTIQPLFQQIGPSAYGKERGITDKSVMSLCFDKNGQLWVGTNSFGLNVLSENLELKKTFPNEIGPCIQTACRDSEGNLWFGAYNGGLYIKSATGFKKILPKGTEDVRALIEDDQKLMWVGTSDGVYAIDVKSLIVRKRLRTQNNLVRAIAFDANRNIWIGTYGGGIEIYSPKCTLQKLLRAGQNKNIMPSDIVTQIIMDSKSQMWVATNDGVLCFKSADDSLPRLFDRKVGLENCHIRALIEDRNKNIWLSSNKGISCLTAEGRKVINFTYKDNVPINNFNDRCVAVSPDGRIFFGSAGDGICYFDPQHVMAERPAPHVKFTSLYLLRGIENNDSLIFLSGKRGICLNHDENNFRISYVISNFSLKNQVEYSYRIEGLQNAWLATLSDQLVLRDVPYGRYKLLVRARFHNQKWSEAEELQIEILPPLWLTWWAKLIYFVIVLVVGALTVRSYKRHLKLKYMLKAEKIRHEQEQALNEERLRFFTNITHELRTPVTLILGPLDEIAHASGVPEKIKHTLAICYQSAMRLNELIKQILEFRKLESNRRQLRVKKQNVVDTVHDVVLKYVELAQKPDLKILFATVNNMIEIYFDKDVVEIIMDNLMSNAIKYTAHGKISVSIKQDKREGRSWIDILVSDTGHGISTEALPHIFERYYQENGLHQASGTGIGLSLVKNLVDLHSGHIDVKSALNKGTVFTISLDADRTYPEALHELDEPIKYGEYVQTASINDTCDKETLSNDTSQIKKTILIVEDNKLLRNYVADSFRNDWFVYEAEDGTSGLDLALDKLPDVIVSDVIMPNMDGNELCRRIKNDSRTSHILFILLIAKDSLDQKAEGYEAGADSYLTKPFTNSLLKSRINNLIAQRQRIILQLQSCTSPTDLNEKKRQLRDSLNKIDREFFDKLEKIMIEHISGDLDLGILTNELAMSTSTLYRKIKTLTGLSPNEYIRKYKMQYAERLLLEGTYSIGEIAYMVGMNSAAYFRRCFKAEYGMLPSEYLNKLKENNS